MNDYERLLARVKELNSALQSLTMSAYHSKIDSTGGGRMFYDGQQVAYDDAKQLVEKIIEEFPDKVTE